MEKLFRLPHSLPHPPPQWGGNEFSAFPENNSLAGQALLLTVMNRLAVCR